MNRNFVQVAWLVSLSGLFPAVALAQPPAAEVAKRSLDGFYAAGRDMRVRVSMTLKPVAHPAGHGGGDSLPTSRLSRRAARFA